MIISRKVLPGLLIACVSILMEGVGQPPPPMQSGDGIWVRNAYYGEFQTFDKCFGHQPGNGQYHHHVQPICLRAQLNDNLEVVSTGRVGTSYREKAGPWTHSPILGWALDGYPIYGPYGFSDAANASSPVRRMRSGFRLRGITQRTTLPEWALGHHPGVSAQLSAAQYGPEISDFFPLGRYLEDYEFVAGSGDLDQYNGRFAVTPEYPGGTYAYFVTIGAAGEPVFPYIIGMQYYGLVAGSGNSSAPADAQTAFAGGVWQQSRTGVPHLSAWLTKYSQETAKVVSGFDPSAGAKPTWPESVIPPGARTAGGVATPALADVQGVSTTETAVYVASNNLASYAMGPWFVDAQNGGVFMNFPSTQNFRVRLPKGPTAATTRQTTGLGPVGVWVNGVAVFNVLDGASYSNAQRTDVGGGGVRPGAMHISAASFEGGPMAPGSLISAFSLFGSKLAASTASAQTPEWPTTLGGTTVVVRDATGATHNAVISYASPGQINYRLPEAVSNGLATVTITAGGTAVTGSLNVVSNYPNLFKFNDEGLAAAGIVRVRGGVQSFEDVYEVKNGAVVGKPIDLGPAGDEVYLVLYGSGLGKSGSPVSAKIGDVDAAVIYAGPQGTFQGLDQFNVRIPPSLAGRGRVTIQLTTSGRAANPVNIVIR